MTKKDLKLIASVLKDAPMPVIPLVEMFIKAFEEVNPKFNASIFRKACGIGGN